MARHEGRAGSATPLADTRQETLKTTSSAIFPDLARGALGDLACSCRGALTCSTCADWRGVFRRLEARNAAMGARHG